MFIGKHLCQGLFLSHNIIKKDALAQGFSCECCKIFKNTFFKISKNNKNKKNKNTFFETIKHNKFDQIWKFKIISNIFQATHDILVLTDPVIICTYLSTTDRHFRDQGNVRHPNSKLLKCDLVQTLNTVQNPSLRDFAAEKASLVYFIISV